MKQRILILFLLIFSLTFSIQHNTYAKSGDIIKREKRENDDNSQKNTLDKENDSQKNDSLETGNNTGTSQTGAIKIEPTKSDTNETERKKIELRLKRDINAYIIESYKVQGNKIIKDLHLKLTRTIPNVEERKLALEKIQESLKSRLEKTEEIEQSDSKKEILQEFLRHLIQLLDKRIDEMEN